MSNGPLRMARVRPIGQIDLKPSIDRNNLTRERPPLVELRHLRYFVAVADLLHFGRAAERLGIAQPSLSQQIQDLERDLGTPLLVRSKRQVQLTDAGRLFLDEARDILARAARARVTAERAGRGEAGRLAIGFGPWMDYSAMPKMIRLFGERHRDVQVQIRSLSTPQQIAALKDSRLDVGFFRQAATEPWLSSEPLVTEPFVLAVPTNHRLARRRTIEPRVLGDQPFIAFPRETAPHFYDAMVQFCRDAGFVPQIHHDADHPLTVLALVATGIGVALVPASLRRVPRPGVMFRSLRGVRPTLETAVAWRTDNHSATVETFVRIVRELVRRL